MSNQTHIFYVPHADDETINMGCAVLDKLNKGHKVMTVLLTDGAADETFQCLNGKFKCKWHNCFHNPEKEDFPTIPFDKSCFSEARQREFSRAVKLFGIPENNHIIYNFPDNGLQQHEVESIVIGFENVLSGDVYHHTMSYLLDDHHDHLTAGKALYELRKKKIIQNTVWYIKRACWDMIKPEHHVKSITAKSNTEKSKLKIICHDVYENYNPSQNSFAIGYHSVSHSFECFQKDFTNKYHLD